MNIYVWLNKAQSSLHSLISAYPFSISIWKLVIQFHLFGPNSHLHYGVCFFCYRSGNIKNLEVHINKWLLHPLYSCYVLPDGIKRSHYKVESGYLQGLSFPKKKNNQTQALKNETIIDILNKIFLFKCQFQSWLL